MKKQLLLLSFLLLLSSMAVGQVQFGVGGTLINDFGVQGRAKISITDKINALPAVSYFFSTGTVIGVDFVGSYDVAEVSEFPIYATGGLSLLRFSGFGTSITTKALSLGAGTVYNSNIYGEIRLLLGIGDGGGSDIGINVGYYF